MKDVTSFDRWARWYDLTSPTMARDVLAAGLRYADRDVELVLDLAGGAGRAARSVDAEALVVDAARGMLREARGHGLETVQGDASRLPVRDASVDAVVVADALHHVHDGAAAVEEAARVLRPGGVLVVREFDPTTLRGRLLAAGEHLFGFESTFRSADDLAELVEAAGLTTFLPDRGFAYTVVGVR